MSVKTENINLDKLEFDSFNPRLPKSYHGKSENEIIEYMLLEASTIELMQAIGENGFFPGEQLLVVKEASTNYKVVEGNRRLTALKLLQNPDITKIQKSKVKKVFENSKHQPEKIPCLLFDDEYEIRKYLGYRHVTGIKAWKALEKARYLQSLLPDFDDSYSFDKKCGELAKQTGSRRDYVKRQLVGIKVFDRIEEDSFLKIANLDDTTFHFVNLTDSLNRSNLTTFFEIDFKKEDPLESLNYENVKEWTHWLFEKNTENTTRLRGTSKDLTSLDKIVSKEKALKAFRQGTPLKKALELTEDISDLFHESVHKSGDYLAEADQVVHKVDKNTFSENVKDELRDIARLSKKIKMAIEDVEDEF